MLKFSPFKLAKPLPNADKQVIEFGAVHFFPAWTTATYELALRM